MTKAKDENTETGDQTFYRKYVSLSRTFSEWPYAGQPKLFLTNLSLRRC